MKLRPLPETLPASRDALHRVAAHVLARRRHQLCGKVGLRATPGGVSTPACGPDDEVVRVGGSWLVLDATGAWLGPTRHPTVIQLWPEHFDAACDVGPVPGPRVNLGVSTGDAFSVQPYLYVGPWDADRPGDPDYWNAQFGAVLRYGDLRTSRNPVNAAGAFLRRGLDLLHTGGVAAAGSR